MVLPLIPIVAGAVGGIAVEKGLTSIFGGTGTTKKETRIGGEYHAPHEVWSPTTTYAQTYQYQGPSIAVDSPFAKVGGTMTATAAPDVAAGVQQAEGMDTTKIAIIGVAGLIVYGLVSQK